ncbi:hypothetical protein KIS1582_3437 [Cytobacillus firmus]|uniref:Uncharacterized protein n=1 Tax=Cytobacillus firmus TaxID=1399 RepID=A0A800N9N6_CYTFI|nr:hypothetical protein KIS1582_3437 [Cytobacillus firmus]
MPAISLSKSNSLNQQGNPPGEDQKYIFSGGRAFSNSPNKIWSPA